MEYFVEVKVINYGTIMVMPILQKRRRKKRKPVTLWATRCGVPVSMSSPNPSACWFGAVMTDE